MSCSLRIKCGDVEVEYSGEEAFAEKHLKPLIDSLAKSFEQAWPTLGAKKTTDHLHNKGGSQASAITTSTVATKLAAKTGTDLALAAAYVLHASGKDQFTRTELTDTMRDAKSYFNVNYAKNLTNSLKTLVKQQNFLHQGGDDYALSVSCKADLDKKLA